MADREKYAGVIVPRFWDDSAAWPIQDEQLLVRCQLLAAFLVTGRPSLTGVPGLIVAGPARLAEDMHWSQPALLEALGELERVGFVQIDRAVRLVRVPNAPKFQPANHKVILHWFGQWQRIPESPLKYNHVASLHLALSDSAGPQTLEAWAKSFGSVDFNGRATHSPTVTPRVSQPSWSLVIGIPDPDPENAPDVPTKARGKRPHRPTKPPRSPDVEAEIAWWAEVAPPITKIPVVATASLPPNTERELGVLVRADRDNFRRQASWFLRGGLPWVKERTLVSLVQHFARCAAPSSYPILGGDRSDDYESTRDATLARTGVVIDD